MDRWISRAEEALFKTLYRESTHLVYEVPVNIPDSLPRPDEIARFWPNPVGYGTGMEDSMINGGTLLDAYACLYEKTKADIPRAHALADGLLSCAEAGKDGFLPRSLSPYDGISHYIDSSIDQYTMFTFGLFRLCECGMATDAEKHRIARAFSRIADRAEKNVKPENDWDMLREDGGRTLVTRMWGESIGPHGWCRLPMLYAAAFRMTGKAKYERLFLSVIDEALSRTLPLDRVWHLYALQQAVSALYVIGRVYPAYRDGADTAMKACCAQARSRIAETDVGIDDMRDLTDIPFQPFRELPVKRTTDRDIFDGLPNTTPLHRDTEAFFRLQDAANIPLIHMIAGERVPEKAKELFLRERERLNIKELKRAHIVHFLASSVRMDVLNGD